LEGGSDRLEISVSDSDAARRSPFTQILVAADVPPLLAGRREVGARLRPPLSEKIRVSPHHRDIVGVASDGGAVAFHKGK